MATLNRLPIIAPGNPALDLNFATGLALIRKVAGGQTETDALDGLLAFSRASPGWAFGPDGLLGRVEANRLRYDYDPITKAPRGVLIERGSANIALWSNNPADPVYARSNLTLFGGAVDGISGQNSGTRIVDTAGSGSVGTISQTVGIQYPVFHSAGTFVRPVAGATQFRLRGELLGGPSAVTGNAVFDLATGKVLSATGCAARCTPGPNGYWRPQISIANGVGATSFRYSLERANASDAGTAYDACETQIEQRFPLSSPILTAAVPVTRADERMSLPIGAWWSPLGGAITVECTPQGDSTAGGQQIFALRNDAGTQVIGLERNQYGPAFHAYGTGGADFVMYGADTDLDHRLALRVAATDWAGAKSGNFYVDGNLAASGGPVPPGLTTLDILHNAGGNQFDGVIRRLVIEHRLLAAGPLSDRVRS